MNFLTLNMASILEIGKNILSTVTINYELIFGLGITLISILVLLIALVWPRKQTVINKRPINDDENISYRSKRRSQVRPWKKILLLIGLILLLIGICLLSSSAVFK